MTPLAGIVDIRPIGPYNIAGFCPLTASHIPLCWGSGFSTYPDVYVAPNLVSVGWINSGIFGANARYLGSDGIYRVGGASRMPDCGLIQ